MPIDCPHKPECGPHVTHYVCGQRTRLEDGVKRGFIQRDMAERLLRKYGVGMTPASKVFVGKVVKSEPRNESLFKSEL